MVLYVKYTVVDPIHALLISLCSYKLVENFLMSSKSIYTL